MRRVLFDVNVILDVLLDRKPFADSASAAWAAVEEGVAEGYISAHAVTTLHYLNTRAVGARMARDTTEALLSVFDVAGVDGPVLKSALDLGWSDFEDAVSAAAARRAGCDAIVTRNTRDYKPGVPAARSVRGGVERSPVRVLTPSEAVAWLRVG